MLFIGSICRTSDVGLGYNLMLALKSKFGVSNIVTVVIASFVMIG